MRLPESAVTRALARLAEFQRAHRLLERDVVAVDLRLPDRLIVQVNEDAVDRARATGENT